MKKFCESAAYKLVILVACASILLSLVGCSSNKTGPIPLGISAKSFMRSIFSGDATRAANMLCMDGKIYIMLAVKTPWTQDKYSKVYKTPTSEQDLITGHLLISTNDLKPYLPQIEQALAENGYNVPDINLDNFEGVLSFGVRFDQFFLNYDQVRKSWCVDGKSYYSFVMYLLDMVAKSAADLQPTP